MTGTGGSPSVILEVRNQGTTSSSYIMVRGAKLIEVNERL